MRRIHSPGSLLRAATATAPCAALALLAGAPGASRAQEQAPGSEASGGPLQEVIVTATRRAEGLSKVPISVTALTHESLDDRGLKDFSEVAPLPPGANSATARTNKLSAPRLPGPG